MIMPAIDADTPQIYLNQISFHYGRVTALDNLSLAVAQGEIISIVGPSGCGKSTLMRLIAGLIAPTQGQIAIANTPVFDGAGLNVPAERRGVGLVFQDYALFPHLNAWRNVAFGLHRMERSARKKRASDMLALVGLQSMAERFPHELSGGQQQRVALARALAPEPAVLLMDEPFSGLDAQTRENVRDQVINVLRQTNTTALIVTHDPDEAMRVGDRLAVLNQGRLAQLGTAGQIYHQPASSFVAKLFGDINMLPVSVEGGVVLLPGGVKHPDPWADTQPPIALIRPERVLIHASSELGLKAKVTACRANGPDYTLSLAFHEKEAVFGLKAKVSLDLGRKIAPDSIVSVRFNPVDVHLVSQ